MSKLIAFLLLVAGIIHLLPAVGVLGGERLNA
ncbi:MAG: phosphopantetheine adenylyltransferase, partial [Pseudomonas sp.]|nr:phosphopantetheine adenylyltransferase [Pseudomonas sp.]